MIQENGKLHLVTLKELLTKLRARVAAMGRACLGFGPLEIGTHSIRSAAAMSNHVTWLLVKQCIPLLHLSPSSTVPQWNIHSNDYQ
jgi:hypothetical protein